MELDENAPEADIVPSRPSRPRLQMTRINPAALTMLSGALELLTPAVSPSEPKPARLRTRIGTEALLLFSTDPIAPPPDVCPCDISNAPDPLQDVTSDKMYHLFRNRRFRNYEHFGVTSMLGY